MSEEKAVAVRIEFTAESPITVREIKRIVGRFGEVVAFLASPADLGKHLGSFEFTPKKGATVEDAIDALRQAGLDAKQEELIDPEFTGQSGRR